MDSFVFFLLSFSRLQSKQKCVWFIFNVADVPCVRRIAERFKAKRINFLGISIGIKKENSSMPSCDIYTHFICVKESIDTTCNSNLESFSVSICFFSLLISLARWFLLYACMRVRLSKCVDSFIHRLVNGRRRRRRSKEQRERIRYK